MRNIFKILIFCISAILGTIAACTEHCPETERFSRGIYYIVGGDGILPMTEGSIEVRDGDVEIVYSDKENHEWHVAYKIIREEYT
jgi:hypothetical protein